MTERFSVWVLFPDKKVSFYKAELLFGKNNQSVKDNFIFLTDENNNLLLKTTRPLPAYTDVRLNLVLDAKKIPVSQRNIFDFNNEIILGIYILVLAFYVLISIYECRYSKIKLKLKKCMKINTKVLFSILSGESKSLSVIIKALFLFCLEYIFGILFLILSLFIDRLYTDIYSFNSNYFWYIGCWFYLSIRC